ncbi:MAG: M28 family peptidase [Spirosomataceae bacterium]
MKKLLPFALVLGALTTSSAQKKPEKFATSILAEDLKKHLSVIANDSLEGRGTGTPGQWKAAKYIANHFKNLGLKPVGTDGSYFQKVELAKSSWKDVYLVVNGNKKELYKDFVVSGTTGFPSEQTVEAVYAKYGIEAPTYSDLNGVDVKGKVVIINDGEPKKEDGTFLLSGTEKPSEWSDRGGVAKKVKLLSDKGAIAVFTVAKSSDEEQEKVFVRMKGFAARLNQLVFKNDPNRGKNPLQMTIKQGVAKEVLGLTDAQLADLASAKLPSGSAKGSLVVKAERLEEDIETSNVVGFMEGKDLKDEVIIITAHYDHIGISPNGQINNGANDDGSGTVTVMEVAEAFAAAKAKGQGPRRSILFMTVTGEERGLLGSEYYVEHPIFPLEKTVVDLNIDMVGRVDKEHEGKSDYIYVIGSDKLSSELHLINEEANTKYTQLDLDYRFNDPKDPNRFYYRSDHYNFAKKKIPVAFYFNGVHPDYHQPTDDIEKIQFDKAEKVGRLVFYTAWEIANRDKRIVVDSNKP